MTRWSSHAENDERLVMSDEYGTMSAGHDSERFTAGKSWPTAPSGLTS